MLSPLGRSIRTDISRVRQTLESYDQDSYKTVDYLLSLPTCTGLIGATGMCLGGHLALRAAVSLNLELGLPSKYSLGHHEC